jgi:hypothetical protein
VIEIVSRAEYDCLRAAERSRMGFGPGDVPWYIETFFLTKTMGKRLAAKGYFEVVGDPSWSWWELTDAGRDALNDYETTVYGTIVNTHRDTEYQNPCRGILMADVSTPLPLVC